MLQPDTSNSRPIKVGSRKSELALIQTKYVISQLQKFYPDAKYEIHTMTTVGDRVLNKSLPKIGEKSLFTRDLEEALSTGNVDFVVHSLKDLPTQLPSNMTIGAVLKREDARDALVLNTKYLGKNLKTLPEGSIIGTSSLRRTAQLTRNYKNLKVCDIRGNLNTRLAKLDAPNSQFAGIILAHAGLERMGWNKRVDQVLEPSDLYYAVGQGALAVECRVNDHFILDMLNQLCDIKTQCRILAERSFLKTLGGGCSAPVAVKSDFKTILSSKKEEVKLEIRGGVWSLNGEVEILNDAAETLEFVVGHEETDEIQNPKKKLKVDDNQSNLKIIAGNCPEKCQREKNYLENLVSLHGKMVVKCPYSGNNIEVNNAEKNELLEGNKLNVSVNIPIGQDFMGDCPVLNTEEKVKYEEALKIAESTSEFNKNSEECPFIIIDYEAENKSKAHQATAPSLINENDCSVKLYCGLFARDDKIKTLFEKSESLGINLANKLIADGALNVMQKAQNEIHSKV